MNEAKPSPLWDSLSELIESEEKTLEKLPVPSSTQEEFSDRLLRRVLNGLFPLMVLYFVGVWLGGHAEDNFVLWGGLAVAPLVAWLLRPLVCTEFGMSPKRLLGVSLGLLLVIPLTQWLPLFFTLQATSQELEAGLRSFPLYKAWQHHLEQVFLADHLIFYVIAVAFFGVLHSFLKKQRPWLQFHDSRWWQTLPALGLLLLPWGVMGVQFLPDTEIENWRREVKPLYEKTYVSKLPHGPRENHWEELRDSFYTLRKDKPSAWLKTSEGERSLQAHESAVLERIQTQPPKTLEELKAAEETLQRLVDRAALLKNPVATICTLRGEMFRGLNTHQYTWDWWQAAKWAGEKTRTKKELEDSLKKVRARRDTLLQSLDQVDLFMYHTCFGSGQQRVVPVMKRGYRLVNRDPLGAHPLKLGPWKLEASPVNLYRKLQRGVAMDAWLETRPLFEDGLTRAESKAMFLTSPWDPDMGTAAYFQHKIFQSAQNDELTQILEGFDLYLQLRIQSLEGEPSLEALGLGDQERWEIAYREPSYSYTITKNGGKEEHIEYQEPRVFRDTTTNKEWDLP